MSAQNTKIKVPPLVMLASFVVVVAGMKAASAILVPFLLSVFIAVVCTPPLFWLQSKHVPKAIALFIVMTGVLLVEFLFAVLIVPSLNDFMASLPKYQDRLAVIMSSIVNWLRLHKVTIPETGLPKIQPEWILKLAGSMLSAFTAVVSNAFLILLTVIFILSEAAVFPDKLRAASKNPEKSLAVLNKFTTSVKQYLVTKTLLSIGIGVAIWLWLLILGVDYPVLWGALSFLMNFIPNIGSVIAAVPIALLALIQKGMGFTVIAMLGFSVIHTVAGNILEPKLMSKRLSLSTLVVFLSMIVWGWVLGPVGMILSVPMTSFIKIGLESDQETRRFAIMMDSEGEQR